MGSLMPGWAHSTPGVAPKGMVDHDDSEQADGYFARLERQRSLRRASLGSDASSGSTGGAVAPLRRASIGSDAGGQLRRASLSGDSGTSGGSAPQRVLPAARQGSLPKDWKADDADAPPRPLGSAALGEPGSLKGRLNAAHSSSGGARKYSWWDKMNSSALNERPDAEEARTKGFTPQYSITGQGMHYRADGASIGDDVENEAPVQGAPVVQAAA